MSSDNNSVIFSVTRDTLLGGTAKSVTFKFTLILFNDYSHFNDFTNKFTAPSSGIYFFTLSVGVTGGLPVEFMLYVNNVPISSKF